jgi:hypothetical protein
MRNLRCASIALLLSLNAGCGATLANAPAVASKPPAAEGLVSKWPGGSCAFKTKENSLSYSVPGKTARIVLDEQAKHADGLICGAYYSVVLSGDKAIVTIGGEGALASKEFIGQYGGRFTFANSYSIDISDQRREGIEAAEIHISALTIRTKGRRWSIDLSDPQEWSISGKNPQQWLDLYSPQGRIINIH